MHSDPVVTTREREERRAKDVEVIVHPGSGVDNTPPPAVLGRDSRHRLWKRSPNGTVIANQRETLTAASISVHHQPLVTLAIGTDLVDRVGVNVLAGRV